MSFFLKKVTKSTILLLVLFSFFIQNSFAQSDFSIVSDKFFLKLKESQMQFSKNVLVKYKMIEIRCEQAIIEVEPKNGRVLKLIMTGNVFLKRDGSEVSGNKVVFEPEGEKLTIEGNVKTKIPFENKN